MIERRDFIKLALGAALAPRVLQAAGGAALTPVVVDRRSALIASFLAQCHVPARLIDGPLEVIDTLTRGGLDGVFGVTRDSCFFVIREMATACGYRLAYHGVHEGGGSAVMHASSGDEPWLASFTSSLERSAAAWPDGHLVSWYLRRA